MRAMLAAAVLGVPVAANAAAALGQGYGMTAALGAVQAVIVGVAVGTLLPRAKRGWAVVLAAVLLAALAWGGPMAQAGVTHAVLYAALLAVFAATLRPGHTALVTRLAARINPHFRAGMVPYTRKVTWAWCLFFTAQLAASAALLATSRLAAWQALVGTLHLPIVAAFALAEFAIRRWRFRHDHPSGIWQTIRAMRQAIR